MLKVPILSDNNLSLVNAWRGLTRRLQTTVEAHRVTNNSGNPMLRGHIVYPSGNGEVELTDADAIDTAAAIGVLVEDIPDGGSGICRNDNVAYVLFVGQLALTAGDRVYVSGTAGLASNIAGANQFSIGLVSDVTPYATEQAAWVLLDRCCEPYENELI